MQATSNWFNEMSDAALVAIAGAAAYLPQLLLSFLVLVAGWLVARLVRSFGRSLADQTNRVLDRVFTHGALASARLSRTSIMVVGEVAYWIIIFIAVAIAVDIAGLSALSSLLERLVSHLPNILLGAAVVVAGYFVSVIVGEQITSTARASGSSQAVLLGRVGQGLVFVTAGIIGLDQIGVDVTFLIAIFAVTAAAIFTGFSIAFGVGARDFVSNLIGARNARRELLPGSKVRIGEIEGDILEVTQTQIVLDTNRGRMLIPGHYFDKHSKTVLTSSSNK